MNGIPNFGVGDIEEKIIGNKGCTPFFNVYKIENK
jgi:hypothetical protein